MPRTKKPQIFSETTDDLQRRLDEHCVSSRASKRTVIETAIDNYLNETDGRRAALALSETLSSRFLAAQTKQGYRPEWILERALDEFLSARDTAVPKRVVVDLSDRVAARFAAYRRVRSNPDSSQLLEDVLDDFIETDVSFNDDLKKKFSDALTEIAKQQPN
jgi:predicted transcriptional regulator